MTDRENNRNARKWSAWVLTEMGAVKVVGTRVAVAAHIAFVRANRGKLARAEDLWDARCFVNPDGTVPAPSMEPQGYWINAASAGRQEYGADKTGEPHIPASSSIGMPGSGGQLTTGDRPHRGEGQSRG